MFTPNCIVQSDILERRATVGKIQHNMVSEKDWENIRVYGVPLIKKLLEDDGFKLLLTSSPSPDNVIKFIVDKLDAECNSQIELASRGNRRNSGISQQSRRRMEETTIFAEIKAELQNFQNDPTFREIELHAVSSKMVEKCRNDRQVSNHSPPVLRHY